MCSREFPLFAIFTILEFLIKIWVEKFRSIGKLVCVCVCVQSGQSGYYHFVCHLNISLNKIYTAISIKDTLHFWPIIFHLILTTLLINMQEQAAKTFSEIIIFTTLKRQTSIRFVAQKLPSFFRRLFKFSNKFMQTVHYNFIFSEAVDSCRTLFGEHSNWCDVTNGARADKAFCYVTVVLLYHRPADEWTEHAFHAVCALPCIDIFEYN